MEVDYAVSSSSWSVSSSSGSNAVSFSAPAPWRAASSYRVSDVRCLKPYLAKGRLAFPCGDCGPCRHNRRRIWSHRICLEAMQHAANGFATLTYSSVPEGGSLCPDDLRNWLKRLRNRVGQVRYYAVGEYGEITERPHYHVALFGVGCDGGPTVQLRGGGFECRCPTCSAVRESWGFGHTMVGTLEERSASYIAGYVMKKMTRWDDPRLDGRHPEFARMSLRPGIGAGAVPDVASVLMQWKLEERMRDVPSTLRHGSHERPLGRYLMKRLRREVGLDEKAPPHVIEALRQGLLPVYEAAAVVAPGLGSAGVRRLIIQEAIAQENAQGARNLDARFKMRRRPL